MKGHLEAAFPSYFAVKVGESVGEWQGSGVGRGEADPKERRRGGEARAGSVNSELKSPSAQRD